MFKYIYFICFHFVSIFKCLKKILIVKVFFCFYFFLFFSLFLIYICSVFFLFCYNFVSFYLFINNLSSPTTTTTPALTHPTGSLPANPKTQLDGLLPSPATRLLWFSITAWSSCHSSCSCDLIFFFIFLTDGWMDGRVMKKVSRRPLIYKMSYSHFKWIQNMYHVHL